MCGIAGFISQRLNSSHLDRLTCAVTHRGPDAHGYFHDADSGVHLGHRRLSIIDLSEAGNQPFYSADGRYVMVYNGELYNFLELREKYKLPARTSSDTEVVIELLAKFGINIINEFNGMFTIALWDKVEKSLTLVRDRFGKKPLLYFHNGDEIIFSSELKSFFTLPVKWEINKEALKDYLFLEYIPGENSILENVKKLEPGHYLQFKGGKSVIYQYYNIYEKIGPANKGEPNEKLFIDEFEELLDSSIRYRSISDVPIGTFLSGGTDSSLICAILQKQAVQPVKSFTIGFDVAKYDETTYANAVAAILGTNHKVFNITNASSLAIVDKLVDYYDEPFAAPSCIPSYLVCNKAREAVTVAMSGDGGDELFMGYGYYSVYKKLKPIYKYMPSIGRNLLSQALKMKGGKYERGSRLFQLQGGDDVFVRIWAEEQYMFTEPEISRLVGEKYNNTTITTEWQKINQLPLDDFQKISLLDITKYLAHNLLYKMDSASMANSLEVRNPLLDYRLMEFALNTPTSLKIKNGEQKYLMKKLLERYLPKELVYRKKWGFPAPVGEWLYGDLKHLPDQWLNKDRITKQGLLDYSEVKKWLDEFRTGKVYHSKRIWSLIIFQMWYEKYFAKA